MAIVKKYYIIKMSVPSGYGDGKVQIRYAQGWGKFTSNVVEAKCYVNMSSIKKLIKDYKEYNPEILYATLTVQDANDILEQEFELTE